MLTNHQAPISASAECAGHPTLRAYAEALYRRGTPAQIDDLYRARARALASLREQAARGLAVSAAQVNALDRLGRCAACNDLWAAMTPEAKDALLHDEHPHVRACADLALRDL